MKDVSSMASDHAPASEGSVRARLRLAVAAGLLPAGLACVLWLSLGQGGFLAVAIAAAGAVLAGVVAMRPIASALARSREQAQSAERELAAVRDEMRAAAGAIGEDIRGLGRGNRELSERTEGQAAAIEEAAASMEQLIASVRHNTDTAHETQRIAAQAVEATAKGIDAATLVIAHMESIREATGKVSEIVSMIDAIAFQTNILALNAAVEAARAGEQGRGFAVVAAEVRSLSQRAADAAREIKALVGAASGEVTDSAAVVDRLGEAIAEINGRVAQVNGLMNAIVTSGAEQSAGIGQVGQTIVQMERATGENAALVDRVVSATDSLQAQSSRLAAMAGGQMEDGDTRVIAEAMRATVKRIRDHPTKRRLT
jgi:methyl-accepting chemotaxis protein